VPSVRIDWATIKDKLDDVTAVYLLTHRQASLILSNIESLEWKATYRDFDYDYSDYDELQLEVADLHHNLTMPVNLVDIITYIDEIESLLRALNTQSQCCIQQDFSDGNLYTDSIVDGVGDVPQNIVDAGYASSSSDWAGFDDYKCLIANIQIENMVSQLRTLAPYVDNAGAIIGGIATVTAILGAILTGTASFLVIGLIGSLAAAAEMINNVTSGALLETLADELWSKKDEAACAIYLGDGADLAVAEFKSWIDEEFNVVDATILKNMNLNGNIKALYAGRHDQQNIAQKLADAGFDVQNFDCSGCSAPVGPVQLLLNPDFTTDLSLWTVSGWVWEASNNNQYGIMKGDPARTTFDASRIKSSNFTIPSGRTAVYFRYSTRRYTAFDIATYLYLYRASDNALIWSQTDVVNKGTQVWITRQLANKTVVPGETYYIRVGVQCLGGSTNPRYDFMYLWTTT